MAVRGNLGDLTSSEVAGTSAALLVPVGSTEQHGTHLPLDTDTRIATAVARRVVAGMPEERDRRWEWLVAPPLTYGASGEHQSFPGTISLGTEALTTLLVEYGRSASCWAARMVFVNGHGGNVAALRAAVATLRAEGRDAAWCPCVVAGGDAHAGHTETSILLHISPADVRIDRWGPGNSAPLAQLMPALRSGGIAAVSEVGVLGDPTTATAADGERMMSEMLADCTARVTGWAPGADGMLR